MPKAWKRSDRFVVGFLARGNCIYGKDTPDRPRWTDPLTLAQAKRRLKTLVQVSDRVIFELVPVLVVKGKGGI